VLQDNEISFTSWLPRAVFRGVGSLVDSNSNVRSFLKRVGEDYPENKLAIPNARPITGFVKSNGAIPKLARETKRPWHEAARGSE